MILGVRTDTAEAELVLAHTDGRVVEREHWEAGRQLADQLLPRIAALLERHDASWSGLTGIVAYQGPGSFTGLRIGLTVANSIGYAQGIPLAAANGKQWLEDGIHTLRAGNGKIQVLPLYGSEPNITTSRK